MKPIKYPRTYHLPWSEGTTSDDKIMKSTAHFIGKRVVVTEKMDGENTTLYKSYIHARSTDSTNHPSRNWVKNFWASISYKIPDNYRVCGENLYAKHSILYNNLTSYFLGFSVWENHSCLDWDKTLEWFSIIGIDPVPILYVGLYNEGKIKSLINSEDLKSKEGYVVRIYDNFSYEDFPKYVGKYVRRNHVQTTEHWTKSKIIKNKVTENL